MRRIFSRMLESLSHVPMPLVLFGACILAYGLLIPWLGFYNEDWHVILYQKYFGAGDFTSFFNQDRPLFAYVYQVFVPIFRDSTIAWQIFALFSHFLAAICFWWLLTKLMPSRKALTTTASLFFVVYPAFQFHWFAVMYGQVFILLAIYFLSYILMIESIRARRGRVFYWIGALLCLIIGIIPQENFVGLELVRPVVIGVVLLQDAQGRGKTAKNILLHWAPYLLILIGFVFYRLGNAENYGTQLSYFKELGSNPWVAMIRQLGEIFDKTLDVTLRAWVNLLALFKRDMRSVISMLMLFLILFGAGFSYLRLRTKTDEKTQPYRNGPIIWISLLATVSAMAPFIAGSIELSLDFPNNRFLLALAPGACLLLAVLVDTLLNTSRQKWILSSLLIGFAIGAQFITARSMMLTWQAQQEFFWQLSWRAPGLKANTFLAAEDLPFSRYYSGASLSAPLNLIYAPEEDAHDIPYLITLSSKPDDMKLTFSPDLPVEFNFRSFDFSGNSSDMLLLKKSADGCLRVVTSGDDAREFNKKEGGSFWQSAIPLSNLDRIISNPENPAIPPVEYFGTENRNQWCYYFEKADLARQNQDWATTIQWYQDAQANDFKPSINSEWLPLLDAYLHTGQAGQALELTKTLPDLRQDYAAGFCQVWEMAKDEENVIPFAAEALSWMNCRE